MPNRQRWAEHVRSRVLGNYAHLRGETRFEASALPTESDLAEFLRRLSLDVSDRQVLFTAHFLAQPRVRAWLFTDVPELLQSASHQRLVIREGRHGGLRGQVDWPATLRLRLTTKPSPSYFVSRVHERSFATPENILLRWSLDQMAELVAYGAAAITSGSLSSLFRQLGGQLRVLLRHPYLRDVPGAKGVTPLMRVRAARRREQGYIQMARMCKTLEALEQVNSGTPPLELLLEGYLTPISDDDLLELYVLICTLDAVESFVDGSWSRSFGLIREKRGAVAVFKSNDENPVSIQVLFDQAPSELGYTSSSYVAIAQAYDVRAGERRPDITISFGTPTEQVPFFLEAKCSRSSLYIRHSIYKALGYIRDFSDSWSPAPSICPKFALVFEECGQPEADFDEQNSEIQLLSADTPDRIFTAVRLFLKAAQLQLPSASRNCPAE